MHVNDDLVVTLCMEQPIRWPKDLPMPTIIIAQLASDLRDARAEVARLKAQMGAFSCPQCGCEECRKIENAAEARSRDA